MFQDFAPLHSGRLLSAISFHQPLPPEARAVTLDDPAVEVMTDFKRVRALTVPPSVTMDYAHQRMMSNRVRLLLVVDDRNMLLGLITTTDIEGDKPLRLVHQRGVRRGDLLVADVMTPREKLEAIPLEDVLRARVGDVVATLKAVGRQHAMVTDHDEQGRQTVRGLFSASQLARQLGTVIHTTEIAGNFAEVEEMLAH
ncbi:MAG: CBS domain-containing protein [Pseudomonadota bacterium]|jgi:CBS domain-containing protein